MMRGEAAYVTITAAMCSYYHYYKKDSKEQLKQNIITEHRTLTELCISAKQLLCMCEQQQYHMQFGSEKTSM